MFYLRKKWLEAYNRLMKDSIKKAEKLVRDTDWPTQKQIDNYKSRNKELPCMELVSNEIRGEGI
jgi:hypothetical protein